MNRAIRIVVATACTILAVNCPVLPQDGSLPPRPSVEFLLTSAKDTLPGIPAPLSNPYLVQIGWAEAERTGNSGVQPGLDDIARAFEAALQVPASRDESGAGKLLANSKRLSEQMAVAITALLDPTQALALARRSDLPRATLFDQVLYSASVDARHANKQQPLDAVGIASECMRSGAFPYRGAAEIILNPAVPEEQRVQLARMAVQFAQTDSVGDQSELLNAPGALLAIHRALPNFDSQTVDAAENILREFAKIIHDPRASASAGVAKRNGTYLLSAVSQIDPSRAGEIASAHPEFVAESSVVASPESLNNASHSQQVDDTERLPPVPPETADVRTRIAAFTVRASLLSKKDPSQALENAERAQSLVTPEVLSQPGMPNVVLNLAAALESLGLHSKVDTLLDSALDALAVADRVREQAFHDGDDEAKLRFEAQQLNIRGTETWQALQTATKVNYNRTATRALSWPAPITRVAALIAVAWADAPNPESIRPNRNH